MLLVFLAWNSPPLDLLRITVTVILINIIIITMILITIIIITIIIIILNNRKIKERKKTFIFKDPVVSLLYMENIQSILNF